MPSSQRRISALATLALAAGAVALPAPAGAQDGVTGCTKFAAPDGSDAAAGTEHAPFRSLKALSDSLSPGETGCLRAGPYEAAETNIANGGSEGAPVTITSYPGERARVVGRVIIRDGADWVVLRGLDLDGSAAPLCAAGATCNRLPSPTVNGDHALIEGNDITNQHQAICVLVGVAGYGRPQGTVIRGNRIHDCGVLPAKNHDHGIYVSEADDTTIVDNVIFDNADRGIQLYPDAQRTTIRGNVIDSNGVGVIFSGASGEA